MKETPEGKGIFYCALCGYEITPEENTQELVSCPGCGDTIHMPYDRAHDVTVKINWQELRILVIWAERWAASVQKEHPDMLKVLYKISDSLEKQRLDMGTLTLLGEINQIRSEFPGIKHNFLDEDLL